LAVIEGVRECLGRALNLDAAAVAGINEATTAADLPGWTSVAHLSLVLELERTFSVTFDNDEIVAMGSVAAILRRLADKGVKDRARHSPAP